MQVINWSHVIAVTDLDAAVQYYRDVLGFDVVDRGIEGWRWFVLGPLSIMAGHCSDEVPAMEINNHATILRIEIDDVNTYYTACKTAGAAFFNEIVDRPWGFREFTVHTNEGHRITFAGRL
jgi:uncharacterized glyoxalase superfamily protein PhnB